MKCMFEVCVLMRGAHICVRLREHLPVPLRLTLRKFGHLPSSHVAQVH